MRAIWPQATSRRAVRAASLLVLLNLLVGAWPLAAGASFGQTQIALARASPIDVVSSGTAPSSGPPSAAGPLAPPSDALPARALTPLSVGAGGWQNWTPYSPSAFTHGSVSLTVAADAAVIDTLPNVTVNQSGAVTILLNGTWNPAPSSSAERQWVVLFLVINGRAELFTVESNTTMRW